MYLSEGNMEAEYPYHNLFKGIAIGIGTWSWGDLLYWGYGKQYNQDDLRKVFDVCLANGVKFFDTAEVYGQGKSENLLGEFIRSSAAEVRVATKFMPFPWRLGKRSVVKAAQGSLKRLGLATIDLYQIHNPLPPVRIETWMNGLVEAKQNNLIQAVGVSNFDVRQMEQSGEALAKQGVNLASNQVEYSLINRTIEKNGLLSACKNDGIRCIAYSPLGMGVLTGKYSAERPLSGLRSNRFTRQDLNRYKPLLELLKKIGADHGGKNASQVSINWVRAKGALPIPGAKNLQQAEQNCDVIHWELTEDEIARLDEMSDRVVKK